MIATLGAGQRLLGNQREGTSSSRPLRSSTESVFLQYAKVSEHLEKGETAAAALLLERLSGEELVVEASAGGEGALEVFSPTTLLMKLARQMSGLARWEATKGNREEALLWISRGRALSLQILASSTTNLDAFYLSHTLDTTFGRAEVEVRERLGDLQGARLVAAREGAAQDFFQTTLMNRLKELPERENIATDDIVSLVESYRRSREQIFAFHGDAPASFYGG